MIETKVYLMKIFEDKYNMYIYSCMYVCMYVYVCIYIYIYIYIRLCHGGRTAWRHC